jgi:hypothetical protein
MSVDSSTWRAELVFRGIFGVFRGISSFLFVYSTISRGTPDNVPQNPGWETLPQIFICGGYMKEKVYVTDVRYRDDLI